MKQRFQNDWNVVGAWNIGKSNEIFWVLFKFIRTDLDANLQIK